MVPKHIDKRLLSACLTALCLAASLPGAAADLSPYRAVYSIEKFNSQIARATYQLDVYDNNLHFTQHTVLTGIASLMRDDSVHETSDISTRDGEWSLTDYSFIQHGSSRPRDMSFHVNYRTDTATGDVTASIDGIYAGSAISLESSAPTWDPLSVLLAIQRDYEPGSSEYRYKVVNKGVIRDYSFTVLADETIEIEETFHDTVLLQREHGKRTTRIWLSKSNRAIPVRMEQHEDGKLNTRMDLSSLTILDDADE